jgi:DNA-binding transcriptional ArsR family regulator
VDESGGTVAKQSVAMTAPQVPSKSLRDNYVQVLKALADSTRLDMIALIGSSEDYACTSLEHELPVGKSTISYHVKILSQAGIVTVRRQGRNFFYTLHRDIMEFYTPGLVERLVAERQQRESAE